VHVDLEVVQQLQSQIGLDNLRTVIDKFGDEARRRWAALTAVGSSADLAREAHTLASTCRSFGLPGVADTLAAIEAHAKAGGQLADADGIDAAADQLQVGISELNAVISDLGSG
jgi:HPt (histidine-containing phosphotransfer) domain-containing protein